MGTPPLSSTKEEIAVVVLTYFQVFWGFSSLTISTFLKFSLLHASPFSFPWQFHVNNYQLFRVDSWPFPQPHPHWSVLCYLAPFFGRIATVLVKFFKSIKSVAFVTGLHALKSRWAGTSSGTDQVCHTPYQCRSKLAASFPLWRAATLAMWASGRCLGVSLSNLAESVG